MEATIISKVLCTADESVRYFSLPAPIAVMAAHAQSLGDYNTWEYGQKYSRLVKRGRYGWVCGEFWAKDVLSERVQVEQE